MKRTSSTASLLSTKRILFFRVRRQPRQDSKKDEWTIPMYNLPLTKHCSESLFVPHAVFSSWNRDQVIFLPCLSIRFNDIHLTQNTYVSPGALNEDFAMKGWLQWNRGCSRIVDESADGFILMDGTSYALLTRRGHLRFYCQDEARSFCEDGSAMFFFLETFRGPFDMFVVVVCIVFPNKIALRHFSSIMVAISFEDFSMLLPFVKIHDLSTFRSRPFVWIRSVNFTQWRVILRWSFFWFLAVQVKWSRSTVLHRFNVLCHLRMAGPFSSTSVVLNEGHWGTRA